MQKLLPQQQSASTIIRRSDGPAATSMQAQQMRAATTSSTLYRFSALQVLQAKPAVSVRYEREANTIAEHAVQPSASKQADLSQPLAKSITPLTTFSDSAPLRSTLRTVGNGNAMDKSTASFMSARFGADFGKVRIHTDEQAAGISGAINAHAFTAGSDIFFGKGKYAPHTASGKALLAHELTHTLQQGGQPQAIQRYESPEHQDLGNVGLLLELKDFMGSAEGKKWGGKYGLKADEVVAGIDKDPVVSGRLLRLANGLKLTPGDVIALMGDFYKTAEDLFSAPKEEVLGILAIIKKERDKSINSGEASIQYQKVTHGRYTALAEKNTTHFSPANKGEWAAMHAEAIKLAGKGMTTAKGEQQPEQSEANLNKALFIDAAAGHFLTDAFAAGHLMNRTLVLAQIQLYLKSHTPRAANPFMGTYFGITASKTDQFILKNIHDHFNQQGYEASNKKGMHWRTFGDDNLKNAAETKHIAVLAIFLSRQQIYGAAKGQPANPDEILDLLPDQSTIDKATEEAIAYIPRAAAGAELESLIYRNRDASELAVGPIFAPVVRANLNAIGAPGFQTQQADQIDYFRQHDFGPPVMKQFSIDLPGFLEKK